MYWMKRILYVIKPWGRGFHRDLRSENVKFTHMSSEVGGGGGKKTLLKPPQSIFFLYL